MWTGECKVRIDVGVLSVDDERWDEENERCGKVKCEVRIDMSEFSEGKR